MKRVLSQSGLYLLSLILLCGPALGQNSFFSFSAGTGSSAGNKESGTAIRYHQLTWAKTGTVSTCGVKVEQSADNITYSDLIAEQTCTSNGQSVIVSATINYVRITFSTAVTGGGTVQAVYTGYNTAPSTNGFVFQGVLASIPATCTVGNLAFITNATAGQNIYVCSATNTWTQVSGGGSSTPTGTGFVHITGGVQDGASKTVATTDLASTTGNGTKIATGTGSYTNGDCVKVDANGNLIDNGSACAAGGVAVQVAGSATGLGTTANFIPSNAFASYAGLTNGSFGSSIFSSMTFPRNKNLYIFGDSTDTIIASQNSDSAAPAGMQNASGYAGQIINNLSTGVGQDWALSGDQWEDMVMREFFHLGDWWLASNASGQYQTGEILMKPGINNASFKNNSTYLTTITRPVIYAALTAGVLNVNNMTSAQAAGCVKTGSWSVDNTTFTTANSPVLAVSGFAEVTQTNGDTIACPIVTTANSPVGVIWYGMVDSNLGTFSASSSAGACTDVVTGGTTINEFGGTLISTHNAATVTIGAMLCPLTAGSYTMTVTNNTGSSGATKKVWILGMGALPVFPGHRSIVTPVILGGTFRDRSDTNPTWTGNYDQESMNGAARLSQTYNFPIQFVPIHDYAVVSLPAAPLAGALADVNDAASKTSCASGSGTNVIRCQYNGSSWDAQLGGIPPVLFPTTTDCYADGVHPNRKCYALLYEQFAPFLPPLSSNNTVSQCFVPQGSGGSGTVGAGKPTVCLTALDNGGTSEIAVGDGTAFATTNGRIDMSGGIFRVLTTNMYSGSGGTLNIQCSGANGPYCLFASTGRFGITNGTGTSNEQTTFSQLSNGIFQINTTSVNADGMISAKGFLSPNVVHVTAQTATKTIYTLCAAASGGCNAAGQYRISWYFNQGGTACGTPGTGGVTFALTWVDNAGTHSAVALPMDDASSLTATGTKFTAQSSNTAAWASGSFNIWSTGASAIQITNTYTACSVGTLTWELAASAERIQ